MSALPGRIAAGTSAVVFALCIGPSPAHAASDLRLHLETVTLAPRGEQKLIPIRATVPESGVYSVRFTVDYTGIAGFASVGPAEVGYIFPSGSPRPSTVRRGP